MENKEQQLPVDQNEKDPVSSENDRIRELFEYEMTEVLLGFKREAVRFKRKDVSEYLDMELPPAGVDYTSTDIALEVCDYSEAEAITQTDMDLSSPEIAAVVFPDCPGSAKVSYTVKAEDSVISVKVPEIKEYISFPQSDNVKPDPVSVAFPDIPDTKVKLREEKTFALPESLIDKAFSEIQVFVPQTEARQSELSAEKHRAGYDIDSVGQEISVSGPEIPFGKIDNSKITVGSVSVSAGQVYFPFAEKSELSFDIEDAFSGVESTQKDMVFSQVHNMNLSYEMIPSAEIPDEIIFPFSGHYAVDYDIGSDVPDELPGADIRVGTISIGSLFAANADLSGIRISVPEAEPVVIPAFSDVEIAPPDYPEIPEKPDFSMYYADILESVSSEKQ